MEMAELAATRKAEVEAIKHFISKQVDRFRVAYGHYIEDFQGNVFSLVQLIKLIS
ncbi:E family protein [Staphylococcus aureus]|uniref:E family protein n=1 Tax=Staphylococcus aureus TaxID=1280 RepID=A0A380EET7_STAAU|nr:E family protein [Staphylococcus aureus]